VSNSLSLGVYLVAAVRIAPALIKIQSNLILINSSVGEVKNTKQILEYLTFENPKEEITSNTSKATYFHPSIEFRNVEFKYGNRDKFEISNFNFSVNAGDTIALTGPSGSGKSTIVDLGLGLLKPISGTVMLSGMEANLAIRNFPGKVGYVPQDSMIIGGSIRENLSLGAFSSDLAEEILWETLKNVNLEKFVRSLDHGLDAQVGEFGVLMSGGQRQRLGIARALISNPELVIFDEATSALDKESESEIVRLVENLRGTKTIIMITHSDNFMRCANKIFRVQDGEVSQVK
jgi:ATP-binding cassette subfamily C protein